MARSSHCVRHGRDGVQVRPSARGVNTFAGGADITWRGPAQRLPGEAGERGYQRPRPKRGAMGPCIKRKSVREYAHTRVTWSAAVRNARGNRSFRIKGCPQPRCLYGAKRKGVGIGAPQATVSTHGPTPIRPCGRVGDVRSVMRSDVEHEEPAAEVLCRAAHASPCRSGRASARYPRGLSRGQLSTHACRRKP